ncbi:haloacid dehalogenase superfamily enzyme, subfamily IA [Thermanaerovibrio velox DSM 12556]|uniref:Haloacid dehalogenase superfamily enzyme, subfamily IA n=1 Tax=Thermanaerovibrio velox DSM 12556 TaxID=926567 RepID=H0UN99_9BACT|nr:HAD family hydrolase [Thermanaerovibrio velox]EHM10384.1 haloacid dehalogenase superfamily enzyme, subfamily IA [Thermanaerovibrio velox DSM 12556]
MERSPSPLWGPSLSKALIFDWDGVLVDSRYDFSPLRERYFGGRRVMLFEEASSLEEPLRSRFLMELEELEVEGALRSVPVEGALEVLRFLEERGIPWGVVSRNCRKAMEVASEVSGIPLPPVTLSRDDFKPPKPDPAPLIHAALLLGSSPWECLLLGDYIYDLLGGRRASMRTCLVNRFEESWASLADLCFESMPQLLEHLKEPRMCVPWEYRGAAETVGVDGLVDRFNSVALVEPQGAFWELSFKAAAMGCGAFFIEDVEVSPLHFRMCPSMPLTAMGSSLRAALGEALRRSFPLVRILDGPNPSAVPLGELLSRWGI